MFTFIKSVTQPKNMNTNNKPHFHHHHHQMTNATTLRISTIVVSTLAGVVTGAFLMSILTYAGSGGWTSPLLSATARGGGAASSATPIQLSSIVHYATSKIIPQQNIKEISLSLNVLKSLAPCNFLVFGLGHDSLMWASLNPGGTTLFLEEDPQWVKTVLRDAPFLDAKTVSYRTQLAEADQLMQTYKNEPDCTPSKTFLKGNTKCRLALESLPEEVYEKEWDVIMIDAPRGYFPEAPGRMAAIYSATVMGRARTKPGVTHVFLHDVDRKVEKEFAEEFLCRKNRVEAAGRLWHFVIHPVNSTLSSTFC